MSEPASAAITDARAELLRLTSGYIVSQAIHVAARLGIADLLESGGKTTAELAAATGTHVESLYRLLRVLVAHNVLTETAPGHFDLSVAGSPLRAAAPDSIRAYVLLFCSEPIWRAWAGLHDSIRTGEAAFRTVFGVSPFEYAATHPDIATVFNLAMAEDAAHAAPALVGGFDFASVRSLVDVGGGNGTLIAAILVATPGLRGVVFDTPGGVSQAHRILAAAGVTDRCQVVAGDFFSSVPPRADAYLLKSVTHDWDDAHAAEILKSCRRAMGDGGRLLLMERFAPARAESDRHARIVDYDLGGLVVMGGKVRTVRQLDALLTAAGFTVARVTETLEPSDFGLIEAVPR